MGKDILRTWKFGGGNAGASADQSRESLDVCDGLATVLTKIVDKVLVIGQDVIALSHTIISIVLVVLDWDTM